MVSGGDRRSSSLHFGAGGCLDFHNPTVWQTTYGVKLEVTDESIFGRQLGANRRTEEGFNVGTVIPGKDLNELSCRTFGRYGRHPNRGRINVADPTLKIERVLADLDDCFDTYAFEPAYRHFASGQSLTQHLAYYVQA